MSLRNYPGDPKDPSDDTPFDALKDNSLKTAGYAYLIGDAALAASGILGGRYGEAASGALWGLGGLAAARYGNPSAERQLKILSADLGSYLRNQNIEIPQTPTTELLAKDGGVIDGINSFLYRYPSQMLNLTYLIGAGTLLRSGMHHNNKWDTASGALIGAGALAGLLVQEKKPDPDHPAKGTLNKAMAWLQEKPLRISSAFYWLNNGATIMSAIHNRSKATGKSDHWFKFLTAASYIFGNAMLSLSSKEPNSNNAENREAMQKLAESAAQVIAAQAPEVQNALVDHIAGHLADNPHVDMKAADISALLRSKLGEARGVGAPGSWMSRLGNVSNTPSLPSF